ncbi:MAG TPA: hypothetical protein VOB72_15250 [Candidatus Dormibacteraeota bacterium]|nr:hypothetical protein [Candidatus Dormibacteraeota bacterium]
MTQPPQTLENVVRLADLGPQLDVDVVLRSPVLLQPVTGRDLVLELLDAGFESRLAGEFDESGLHVLFWEGSVDNNALHTASVIRRTASESIAEIDLFMRPFPVVTRYREKVRHLDDARLPDALWDIASGAVHSAPAGRRYLDVPDLRLAENVAFISPILLETVYGAEEVGRLMDIVTTAHGPRRFHRLARAGAEVVGLFDATVAGQAMEALNRSRFNQHGELVELTAYFKPWPVVKLFEQAVRDIAPDVLPEGYDTLAN